jgi:hypothetical protein
MVAGYARRHVWGRSSIIKQKKHTTGLAVVEEAEYFKEFEVDSGA